MDSWLAKTFWPILDFHSLQYVIVFLFNSADSISDPWIFNWLFLSNCLRLRCIFIPNGDSPRTIMPWSSLQIRSNNLWSVSFINEASCPNILGASSWGRKYQINSHDDSLRRNVFNEHPSDDFQSCLKAQLQRLFFFFMRTIISPSC